MTKNKNVKKLDKRAHKQLRSHSVSPKRISIVFLKYFGKKNGIDLNVPNQRKPHEPMDFLV